MARISTYPLDTKINDNDIIIGSDADTTEFVTKNYSVSRLKSYILDSFQFGATLILAGKSNINQEPDGLDTPLQVTFGPAINSPSDPVQLLADGSLVFNEAGLYLFNGFGNFERQGSSGGVTVTAFRAYKNGVPFTPPKAVDLSNTGIMVPYELTVPIQCEAGDIITWEIMRDSSGVNSGGLYTHALAGGWGIVPSADVNIWKIGQ